MHSPTREHLLLPFASKLPPSGPQVYKSHVEPLLLNHMSHWPAACIRVQALTVMRMERPLSPTIPYDPQTGSIREAEDPVPSLPFLWCAHHRH